MAYRYGIDRNQLMMLPPVLDQYVTHDHPVRAYDAFVEALNFRELGISLDERKVGNSQYDPRSMLKLLCTVTPTECGVHGSWSGRFTTICPLSG
jgi:transposase